MKHHLVQRVVAVFGLVLTSLVGLASGPVLGGPMFGYAPESAQTQASIERRAIELGDAESVAEISRALAAHPHVAGTEGQIATRDYCLARMADWGLGLPFPTYQSHFGISRRTTG